MEGYVRLKSSFGFSTIWLVLDGQDLAYYETLDVTTQTPKKLKGVLNVRDGLLKKFQQPNMHMGIKIKNAKASQKLSFDCPNATAWNAWFNALNRAIKEHIEEAKKLQLPYDYRKVLEIDPEIPKLSKGIITRAYKKISLREHPDKGGNADTFSKITEAYGYLINYQAEMDARENNDLVQYEAIVEKANGVGLGIHLVEDKLREQFVVTQVEETIVIHGLSAEARGEIRIGDALIAIDQDEISHWYFSRLKARLDTSRVPFGKKILLVFERRVPRDEDDHDASTSNFSSLPSSPVHTPLRSSRPATETHFDFPSSSQRSDVTSPPPATAAAAASAAAAADEEPSTPSVAAAAAAAVPIVLLPTAAPAAEAAPPAAPVVVPLSAKAAEAPVLALPPATTTEASPAATAAAVVLPPMPSAPTVASTATTSSSALHSPPTTTDAAADADDVDVADDDGDSYDDDVDDDEETDDASRHGEPEAAASNAFSSEGKPQIATEDVLEVLHELEAARSLNGTLQQQNDELTLHCETLSRTLRDQEERLRAQDETVHRLQQENERLEHENSTMRGLLLHDQFPQTAATMKEYLLLLQKEVIALRTQLKEFDPYVTAVVSPQQHAALRMQSDGDDANFYATVLLQQQQQQDQQRRRQQRLSSPLRTPSATSPLASTTPAAASRSRSPSATRHRSPLSATVPSPRHSRRTPTEETPTWTSPAPARSPSGVQQVYRQREDRARTVEIKLKDLLVQQASLSAPTAATAAVGGGSTAADGSPREVQRRLSQALGHDQQYRSHQTGFLNYSPPPAVGVKKQ